MPRTVRSRRAVIAVGAASLSAAILSPAHALPVDAAIPPTIAVPQPAGDPTADALRDNFEHRAFAFFWNESDPVTGLTKDRARNLGSAGPDTYTVASVALTGYALTALTVGVERGWISRPTAKARGSTTLRWFRDKQPNVHGFYYHFVDWKTGERQWKCELSSIDSGLFLLGAITAGQYFGGEAKQIADGLYARTDWQWMRDGVAHPIPFLPKPLTLCMGWNPEHGFLEGRWQGYEDAYLYLLSLGAPKYALDPASWTARMVTPSKLEGFPILGSASPIFWVQMTPGYFDQRGKADAQNRNWWASDLNTHRAHVAFCTRHSDLYPNGIWGINASDQPKGYGSEEPTDGKATGTITPTAVAAGCLFVPEASDRAMLSLWHDYRDRAWGKYGFSNALNVPANWYDPDVIGIDLGMMLTCVENHRSGLIWKLTNSHPMTAKAFAAIGYHSSD